MSTDIVEAAARAAKYVVEQAANPTPAEFPIQPYEDIIFIEQQIEEFSAGGLLLAGKHKKLNAGYARAVGPGRWYSVPMDASGHQEAGMFVPTTTKVGDFVIFGRYQSGGEPVEINGKWYLLAREGDLAGKSKTGQPLTVRVSVDAQN